MTAAAGAVILVLVVALALDLRRIRRRERDERVRFELSCDRWGRVRSREDQRVEAELLRAPRAPRPVVIPFVSSRRRAGRPR